MEHHMHATSTLPSESNKNATCCVDCREQRNTKLINLPSYLSALRQSKLLNRCEQQRFVLMNIWMRSICSCTHFDHLPARSRHNVPTENHIFSYSSACFGSTIRWKTAMRGKQWRSQMNSLRRIENRDSINRNITVHNQCDTRMCNPQWIPSSPNSERIAALSFFRILSTVRKWVNQWTISVLSMIFISKISFSMTFPTKSMSHDCVWNRTTTNFTIFCPDRFHFQCIKRVRSRFHCKILD